MDMEIDSDIGQLALILFIGHTGYDCQQTFSCLPFSVVENFDIHYALVLKLGQF